MRGGKRFGRGGEGATETGVFFSVGLGQRGQKSSKDDVIIKNPSRDAGGKEKARTQGRGAHGKKNGAASVA